MAAFASLLVAHLLLSPAPQLEDPKAIQLFEQAKQAFEAEDWDTASKKLEQVYLIEPKPHVLYPWAQAGRSAGRCEAAVDLYEKFIDSDPPTRLANAARDNIDRCKATTGATSEPVEGTDDEVAPAMDPGTTPRPTSAAMTRRPGCAAPIRSASACSRSAWPEWPPAVRSSAWPASRPI